MSINVTISLADQYAAAKAAVEAATAALDDLKAQVKALGQERIIGVTCDLTLSLVGQQRIDQKLLKSFLTDAQIEACKVESVQERITIKCKGMK